jgi:integrase
MTRYVQIVRTSRIYNLPINRIKVADVKSFYVGLHDSGYSFGTISSIHSILKMSFDMALEDDAILKSPCNFKLKSIVDDDTAKVQALTKEEEQSLFDFLKADTFGRRHIDMMTILIGTGLRISEFAALTINDIDFMCNVIHVNKQIVRLVGKLVVTEPKTESGIRDIPMTPQVRLSAKNLIVKRSTIQKDVMIAGYVGFLSVTRNGRPRTHSEYADTARLLMERYNEASDTKIDRCTPHVLRHTFCTRCIAAGMDIKTVQYLMGHSDASTTLNVYADNDFCNVVSGMKHLEMYVG